MPAVPVQEVTVRLPGALLALAIVTAAPITAGRIDITNETNATVAQGKSLAIHFGVWNYGYNNPEVSPYPAGAGLLILGPDLAGLSAAAIPGTTIQYYPGFLFEARLESRDGSISVPLVDSNASLLGLPAGRLVVTHGTYAAGGGTPLAVSQISAFASLPAAVSEALFDLASYNDGAVIRLHNLGEDFTIGLGPGWSVGSSVFVPDISGAGAVTTSGIRGQVVLENPEPSTWFLLAGGIVLLCWRWRRLPAGNRQAEGGARHKSR